MSGNILQITEDNTRHVMFNTALLSLYSIVHNQKYDNNIMDQLSHKLIDPQECAICCTEATQIKVDKYGHSMYMTCIIGILQSSNKCPFCRITLVWYHLFANHSSKKTL